LKELCREILSRHAIPANRILGHSDVAPARKDDPGELFPWKDLAEAGVGLWPEKLAHALDQGALPRFGYDPQAPRDKTIIAFQRHFRAQNLSGRWDEECGRLLADLLAKSSTVSL
jgi:N-acetylmuramoyl-L-alanine amidase